MTDTKHTDSVEATAEKIYDAFPYDEAGVKPRWQPNGNSNMQERARAVARHILADCQTHTSQQVEEAVLQADATGAYHSGYLAGKAEVEEAVRKERERIIAHLITCKMTIDTVSTRREVIPAELIWTITPNHQD